MFSRIGENHPDLFQLEGFCALTLRVEKVNDLGRTGWAAGGVGATKDC